MKCLILLIALILAVAQVKSDYKEDMNKINMECRAESHANEDNINAFFKGDIINEPTGALKCHMKCLMEKQGHWNNGGFDAAVALKKLKEIPALKDHHDKIGQILDDCKDKKGANECETAYLITKCIVDNHPTSM